ncbi:hypothetical protein [Pontibacter mangrovi]|uniref:Uncharacterized protein n=1 Tax=Pontibacter mangrovi TaxID=2589816 RepID=A0A501WB44_9BACT|nr:hypothetical protein [Pontibacter mangrovi]TPE45274.1 hypothetical protein FJM65_04335 [Pontibacter mangrovi]
MKYTFDVLRSRTVVVLSSIAVMLAPFFLMGLLYTPALRAHIPDFLYRDPLLPLATLVIAPIFLIYNRKYLFWETTDVALDKVTARLTVDGKQHRFNDLTYYELVEGSLLTSGIGRHFLILKFKDSKKIDIVPCRTSESIANYDAFAAHFLSFVDQYFEEDKEKLENKTLKRVAVALLVVANVSFIVLLILYGRAAAKMIPATLTV